MQQIIYTDLCHPIVEDKIKTELGLEVVKRLPDDVWNLPAAASIVTDPRIHLAVINQIDEISLMEIGILIFLCRRILVAAKSIEEYKILARTVDFVEPSCNLREPHSSFISWFKYTERTSNVKTN